MKKEKKKNQRMLRLALAIGLIAIAILIETVGMHPTGIYTYSNEGYKDFQIGLTKKNVLRQINIQKTMRFVKTCEPDSLIEKISRKKLKMDDNLTASNIWMSYDRTGKHFLFIFEEEKIKRILIQRLRFGKKTGSPLFSDCFVVQLKDLDHYLKTREKLNVFSGDGKRRGKRKLMNQQKKVE